MDRLKQRARIIGGKFGIESSQSGQPKKILQSVLPAGNRYYFVNARSALGTLIASLSPPKVWFPSYFCPSMLECLDGFRERLRFYSVDAKLHYAHRGTKEEFGDQDLVVVIEYFGFPVSSDLLTSCNESGATLLVDSCQALLNQRGPTLEGFYLFSIRKFFGLPDGGIVVVPPGKDLEINNLEQVPQEWLRKAIEGLEMRSSFDEGFTDSRKWFEILQEAERCIPCGNYGMSEFSREMMEGNFDISEAVTRRRNNFMYLLDRLEPWTLYTHLPESVVPLGFPVRIRDRDAMQRKLFEREIYPPIHWRLDGTGVEGFEESFKLSKEIMTLPCDQRYDETDMSFLARTFCSIAGDL